MVVTTLLVAGAAAGSTAPRTTAELGSHATASPAALRLRALLVGGEAALAGVLLVAVGLSGGATRRSCASIPVSGSPASRWPASPFRQRATGPRPPSARSTTGSGTGSERSTARPASPW